MADSGPSADGVPGLGQKKTMGGIKTEYVTSGNGYTDDPDDYALSVLSGVELKQLNLDVENTSGASQGEISTGEPYGMDELSGTDVPAGSKVICTAIYSSTGLKDWHDNSILWNRHLNKHLTKYHQIGYHFLFSKFARAMSKYKSVMYVGRKMATYRTRDLQRVMTNKGRYVPGLVLRYLFEPVCYVIGRIKGV